MANMKVVLVRRVKTEHGWKYFPAAYAANGRVRPDVSMVSGKEVRA